MTRSYHIEELPLPGLKRIQIPVFHDDRGFFSEAFSEKKFADAKLPHRFVQMNRSRSKAGTLRGLHYQRNPWQGKLITVLSGKIWDVVVDLRPGPTQGKSFAIELTDDGNWLYVPGGFAHGFCVLGEAHADVLYQVDQPYDASKESGICWDDPTLNIQWPIKPKWISEKDRQLPKYSSTSFL